MEITRKKIEELAPNPDADRNGRALAEKNKFSNLRISSDKTLIWGECAGSGKNPYICSADYVDEHNPVFRCSCPSRQFPCKHALGLLYAYEKALPFATADIPEDILVKREKKEQRLEKKNADKESVKDKAARPKAVNKGAVVKKIDAQLAGVEIAGKMLTNIIRNGLSAIDAKGFATLREQGKELGNYYIPGVQTAFNNLWLELEDVKNDEYTAVIDQINYISALLRKSAEYLAGRKDAPETETDVDSAIEEQIGTVWKLTDLMQRGLWEENAEIAQLSFNCFDNRARREFVDEGIWMNLKSGKIHKTKNYRPYKALKYVKADNSVFEVLRVRELFVYPGDANPRVRWESDAETPRALSGEDLAKIHSFASDNYAETVKAMKNVIKNPLSDKHPVTLLALHGARIRGERLVIEDGLGNSITLRDGREYEFSTETQLKSILPAKAEGLSLSVMIDNDVKTGVFYAVPLSLVTRRGIVRLAY